MKYIQFKESSKKHLKTCECLLKSLENHCKTEQKYISANIIYLTGYTIETILKYRIFQCVNYERDSDIKKINKNGITWDNIKTHDLRSLLRDLRKMEDKSIFKELSNNNHFKNWDKNYHEKARYENNQIQYNHELKNFFELSEKLFKELTQ